MAISLATVLSYLTKVLEIHLVGDLARGKHSDETLKLVVVTNSSLASQFLVSHYHEEAVYEVTANFRTRVACTLLGLKMNYLVATFPGVEIDLYILPSDWKTNQMLGIQYFTQKFVDELRMDAKVFNPQERIFT